MAKIQAILFKRKHFNCNKARQWLKKHQYSPIKRVDKTEHYLRYRLKTPSKTKKYRLIKFGDKIKAVIEYNE